MVSSTYSDLKENRKRAYDVLPRHGFRPIGMEFSARTLRATSCAPRSATTIL